MNWNEILKQNCSLEVLRMRIKCSSISWSSFSDTEIMNGFLERVLQSSNTKDIGFKRECIRFIEDVFHPSSTPIRKCILASPIMQGVYDLLPDGGFDEITAYANSIHTWKDLKSGFVLFSMGRFSLETFCSISKYVTEKELTEWAVNNTLPEDVIDSLFSERIRWNVWSLAERIINKYPLSLKCKCFLDAAKNQSEETIHELSKIQGIEKSLIRTIVLETGKIYNWDFALDYLGQDIIISSDDIFLKIATLQDCKELFNLYVGEYVEKEDLKKIIHQKGGWDDMDSINQLKSDNILNSPQEQLLLSALNSSKNKDILNRLYEERVLLADIVELWCSNRSICPKFPSICWSFILSRIEEKGIVPCSNNKSYHTLKDRIASITNESLLKIFFIKVYSKEGETYLRGFLSALQRGKLVDHSFIENYKTITDSSSYVSLKEIASFKIKYALDIRIVQVAKTLGLLSSSSKTEIITSISRDLFSEENYFSERYNGRFFNWVEKRAESVLGQFSASYQQLNLGQKHAVLTDEENTLVVSSAGSGKTRVIVSKFEYLTQVKGLNGDAIRILAYTKATRKEINHKLGYKKDGPARTFHSFAYEVIKLSGEELHCLADVQESAGGKEIDHSPRAAQVFKLMIDNKIENNTAFMNALSLYAITYNPQKDKNQNLSFYTDRNGKIGSLKSYQEKVIFDFLADNSVDFAYEEESEDGKAHPDFTIYTSAGKIYYEHFASDSDMSYSPYGEKYLADAKRKIKQWGRQLIYTTGAGVQDTAIILNQLKNKLAKKGINLIHISPEQRTKILLEKKNYHEIFHSGIKICLAVFDIIRETGIPIDEAYSRCAGDEYANTFMTVLFKTVITYYMNLLSPKVESSIKLVDYAGLIEHATNLCKSHKIKAIPWDYILIDEYQDISYLRFEFIKSLRVVNPKLKICAVGDDWQSIYSFANSDLSRFKGFEEDWPFSRTIKMVETFRFNNPLLGYSTEFLIRGKDPALVNKQVEASDHAPEQTDIEVLQCNDFYHQFNTIKKIIKSRKIEPADCLILARYNSDLTTVRRLFAKDELFSNFSKEDVDCLMTMHASKGLTRDYVFLLNCNSDVIPSSVEDDTVIRLIRRSNFVDKIYEERRLFYVAITRACKKTFVLYSGIPSVFVNELIEIMD